MTRTYRVLARALLVSAALYPLAFFGAEWWAMRDLPRTAGWTVEDGGSIFGGERGWSARIRTEFAGTELTKQTGDGSPLLFQEIVWSFTPWQVLMSLLTSIGIVGVAALCAIAARAPR